VLPKFFFWLKKQFNLCKNNRLSGKKEKDSITTNSDNIMSFIGSHLIVGLRKTDRTIKIAYVVGNFFLKKR
jgi:hypothetical protein